MCYLKLEHLGVFDEDEDEITGDISSDDEESPPSLATESNDSTLSPQKVLCDWLSGGIPHNI